MCISLLMQRRNCITTIYWNLFWHILLYFRLKKHGKKREMVDPLSVWRGNEDILIELVLFLSDRQEILITVYDKNTNF
jgi:hypothetical protein